MLRSSIRRIGSRIARAGSPGQIARRSISVYAKAESEGRGQSCAEGRTIKHAETGFSVTGLWSTPRIDDHIMEIARCSAGNPFSGDVKLLKYLIKSKHWSPFQMASSAIRIDGLPLFTGRQYLRHWSVSWQEESRRYAKVGDGDEDLDDIFYFARARLQAKNNRQSSIHISDIPPLLSDEKYHSMFPGLPKPGFDSPFMAGIMNDIIDRQGYVDRWDKTQRRVCAEAYDAYLDAIKSGIAREVARAILPSNLRTTMVASANMRSFMHMIDERDTKVAQWEAAIVAKLMKALLVGAAPKTTEAAGWDPEVSREFIANECV